MSEFPTLEFVLINTVINLVLYLGGFVAFLRSRELTLPPFFTTIIIYIVPLLAAVSTAFLAHLLARWDGTNEIGLLHIAIAESANILTMLIGRLILFDTISKRGNVNG